MQKAFAGAKTFAGLEKLVGDGNGKGRGGGERSSRTSARTTAGNSPGVNTVAARLDCHSSRSTAA